MNTVRTPGVASEGYFAARFLPLPSAALAACRGDELAAGEAAAARIAGVRRAPVVVAAAGEIGIGSFSA